MEVNRKAACPGVWVCVCVRCVCVLLLRGVWAKMKDVQRGRLTLRFNVM